MERAGKEKRERERLRKKKRERARDAEQLPLGIDDRRHIARKAQQSC